MNLFTVMNCFLYFALAYNLHYALTEESLGFITVVVIVGVIYVRKKSSGRWL